MAPPGPRYREYADCNRAHEAVLVQTAALQDLNSGHLRPVPQLASWSPRKPDGM